MRALVYLAVVVLALAARPPAIGEELPAMTVWKSPWCGCCAGWIDHIAENGFAVEVHDTEDLGPIKQMAAVPPGLQSCHTARIGGYFIEGHVPAADIRRLLAERPDAVGLAVPGMPSGSPGMETGETEAYDVLLLRRDGRVEVFASHE